MNNMDASRRASPLMRLQRLWPFFRAALSRATFSLIAVAALLGSLRVLTVLASRWITGDGGPPFQALYRIVPAEIAAACMLIAVLVAEQCVRNGVRQLTAYIPAVVVAALLSGLISTPLILFMHDPRFPITSAQGYSGMANIALFVAADALGRGGPAAFIFANRERWLTSVRRLREAEFDRARTERNLADLHLHSMESTLPLASLISALEAIGSLYDHDRRNGDRRLAELIEHLRSVTAKIHI